MLDNECSLLQYVQCVLVHRPPSDLLMNSIVYTNNNMHHKYTHAHTLIHTPPEEDDDILEPSQRLSARASLESISDNEFMFNFERPPPLIVMGMQGESSFVMFAVIGCVVVGIVASMIVSRNGKTVVTPMRRSSRRVTVVSTAPRVNITKGLYGSDRSRRKSKKQVTVKNPIFRFDDA